MNGKDKPAERTTYRKTKFVEDKYLMDWIGCNLPAAKEGFTATDLDLILRDKTGNIMLLETKRRFAKVKDHQAITFQILDAALRRLNGETIKVKAFGTKINVPIKYKGFKLLQFKNTTFEDGDVFLNGQRMSEEEIKTVLSMRKKKKI